MDDPLFVFAGWSVELGSHTVCGGGGQRAGLPGGLGSGTGVCGMFVLKGMRFPPKV